MMEFLSRARPICVWGGCFEWRDAGRGCEFMRHGSLRCGHTWWRGVGEDEVWGTRGSWETHVNGVLSLRCVAESVCR